MHLLKQIRTELNQVRRPKGQCLCRCSEVLLLIKGILIVSGVYHIIGHVMVLLGIYGINNLEEIGRKLYFSWDLAVSTSSWLITQKNTPMVMIHALIHIGAVGHLFNLIPTELFQAVFEMGELDFNNKYIPFILFYVWGTTQDICTHLLNCYYLMSTTNKNINRNDSNIFTNLMRHYF